MSRNPSTSNRIIPFASAPRILSDAAFLEEKPCYCCNGPAKPIDFDGTIYFLCDACHAIHLWANKAAVSLLRSEIKEYKPRLQA